MILHSGDFKLDLTPVDGRLTDLARIGAIASSDGIRLLLSDSTNADEPGHSRCERSVGKVLYELFHGYEGRRILTACFASHIHRVQQIADAAIAFGRTVATMGLSMKKNVRLARDMGLLQIPEASSSTSRRSTTSTRARSASSPPAAGRADVGAGADGIEREPMVRVGEGDMVIISSHPIPGNEANVSKVIDGLVRLGVEVVHSGIEDVHATGHAKQEELKTLLSIARPELFTPVHGEYRHLVATPGWRARWVWPTMA